LNVCWQDALKANLRRSKKTEVSTRSAIVGVGHDLRGDDAAGLHAARALRALLLPFENWLVLEGGPAPENITGALRRFRPQLVLMIDAAQFGASPGTVRWLDWRAAAKSATSTHTGSLNLVARYVSAELSCDVMLLGIQIGDNTLGAPLTLEVAGAVDRVARDIFLLASSQL